MYKHGNKPYVQHYREAVQKFSAPSEGHSRYMQMRLSLAGWDKLRVDMAELPKAFWTEAEWIDACMSKASTSGERVRVGFGRIVVSEIELPNVLVNLVRSR